MALALAVVVGVIVGVVLFNRLGPFPSPSGPESPGASGSPTPSATPTATDSPTAAPSTPPESSPPPPSTEPSPTESSDPDPAFTEQALVQPDHVLERGWDTAGFVNTWEDIPPDQITQCAHPTSDLNGEQAFAATTDGTAEGEQPISMAEVVLRFPDEATAEEAMAELVGRVNSCESAPPGESNLSPGSPEHPATDDKVEDAVLWSAEGEDGQVLAMIGLARADDRIAFFSLSSFGKDGAEPLDPFEIEGLDAGELTIYAGRRLV